MRLEFEIITPIHVQNSILIGEVFQIEVSDGLVHSFGSCQRIYLYIARVLTGARVFRSLYVFRVQNEHSMVSVQNSIFIGEVFQMVWFKLPSSFVSSRRHEFLLVCMCLDFKN